MGISNWLLKQLPICVVWVGQLGSPQRDILQASFPACTALAAGPGHPYQEEKSEPDQNEDRQQNHLNRHENLPQRLKRTSTL